MITSDAAATQRQAGHETAESRALGPQAASLLGDAGTIQRLRPGQTLRRANNPNVASYVVRQGVLATTLDLPGGRRSLLGFHYPGELVASMPSRRIDSSLLATTNVEVRRLGPETVERLLAGNVSAAMGLIAAMHRQAERVSLHCATLARLNSEERLATFLVELAVHIGQRIAGRVDVSLTVGREDIADYLGLNADTVSRIFSKLRKDRVIEFDGRSLLHILDWPQLCTLSPFGAPGL